MNMPPRPSELPPDATFRKSSFSEPNQNCIEIAYSSEAVGVRDTKINNSPVLVVPSNAGSMFLRAVKDGASFSR